MTSVCKGVRKKKQYEKSQLLQTMKFFKILFFYFISFVLCLNSGQAQAEASAMVENTRIMIGDRAKMQVDVTLPVNAELVLADLTVLEKVEGFEILKTPPQWDTITSSNKVFLHQEVNFTIFDNGIVLLPRIPFVYRQNNRVDTAFSEEILMEIVVPETATSDTLELAPIKPIVAVPLTFADFAPWLGAILVLGVILFGLYYFLRLFKQDEDKVIVEPVVIRRPAHEIALEKLQALKDKNLWQEGDIKAYQSELTFIVREYLEDRYGIQALESTTHEILEDLKPINLSDDWKSKLREMLQLADMVKFAKASPPEEAHTRLMDYAESFVYATKKVEVEETSG